MRIKTIDFLKLLSYLRNYISALSNKGIYIILLMYFAYTNTETPSWAKRIVLGTIAYFISPLDSIPDLTPLIGMTDDIGVLSFGLTTIACYINENVRQKAIEKYKEIFSKDLDQLAISEVNGWL